jgi:AhpD family alkylhydroperoxidase
VIAELDRLVALSPEGSLGRINALVRAKCARVLGLPALPSEISVDAPESVAEEAAVDFAEQFSVDVTGVSEFQRQRLLSERGGAAFEAVVLTYIADFAPRVLAGLGALGLGAAPPSIPEWDHERNPTDALFNGFLPAVAQGRALDPVTAEVVRLRGAGQHQCRLCNSLREADALEAGGSEELYGQISAYEASELSDAHKAALRYVDALIWSPADIKSDVVADLHAHFSDDQALELTFDVMRNASNKIAVAMAADAPMVEHGTQRYRILADGSTKYE